MEDKDNKEFADKLKKIFPKEYNSIINIFEKNTEIKGLEDFIFFSIQNKILFNKIDNDLKKINKKIEILYPDFFLESTKKQ